MARKKNRPSADPDDPRWTSEIQPAPGDLRIVQALVDTYDVGAKTDRLATPQALADWLALWGLLPAKAELTQKHLARIHTVRRALRVLFQVHNGRVLKDATVVTRLDEAVASASLRVRFGADGSARYEPTGDGFDGALARLCQVIVRAQDDGSWTRLKACALSSCLSPFFDASRNRSRRWCKVRCGNTLSAKASRRRYPSTY